ncbi:unnamed protein product [Musa textilis]
MGCSESKVERQEAVALCRARVDLLQAAIHTAPPSPTPTPPTLTPSSPSPPPSTASSFSSSPLPTPPPPFSHSLSAASPSLAPRRLRWCPPAATRTPTPASVSFRPIPATMATTAPRSTPAALLLSTTAKRFPTNAASAAFTTPAADLRRPPSSLSGHRRATRPSKLAPLSLTPISLDITALRVDSSARRRCRRPRRWRHRH